MVFFGCMYGFVPSVSSSKKDNFISDQVKDIKGRLKKVANKIPSSSLFKTYQKKLEMQLLKFDFVKPIVQRMKYHTRTIN